MLSKNFSQKTISNYASQLRCFLREFINRDRARNITTDEIEKYLLNKVRINSRNHARCAIQCFYDIVIGQPMKLRRIPWPKKEKTIPIVLSQPEIQSMFNACENLKHRVILALLYATGLRVSELINLKWKHVDRSRMVINILAAKGKKDRQVMLPQAIIPLLEKYYKQYRPKEYVLNGQFELQYSERSVGQVVKGLAAKSWH